MKILKFIPVVPRLNTNKKSFGIKVVVFLFLSLTFLTFLTLNRRLSLMEISPAVE